MTTTLGAGGEAPAFIMVLKLSINSFSVLMFHHARFLSLKLKSFFHSSMDLSYLLLLVHGTIQ